MQVDGGCAVRAEPVDVRRGGIWCTASYLRHSVISAGRICIIVLRFFTHALSILLVYF